MTVLATQLAQRPRGQGVLVCFAKKNTVAWSHSAMPLAPEATGRPGGHLEAKVAVSQLSYDQPWDQLMRGMLMVIALVINIVLYLFHDVKLTLKVFVEAHQCVLSCIAMLNERLASSKAHIEALNGELSAAWSCCIWYQLLHDF